MRRVTGDVLLSGLRECELGLLLRGRGWASGEDVVSAGDGIHDYQQPSCRDCEAGADERLRGKRRDAEEGKDDSCLDGAEMSLPRAALDSSLIANTSCAELAEPGRDTRFPRA